jgi:hypothetical protein
VKERETQIEIDIERAITVSTGANVVSQYIHIAQHQTGIGEQ